MRHGRLQGSGTVFKLNLTDTDTLHIVECYQKFPFQASRRNEKGCNQYDFRHKVCYAKFKIYGIIKEMMRRRYGLQDLARQI